MFLYFWNFYIFETFKFFGLDVWYYSMIVYKFINLKRIEASVHGSFSSTCPKRFSCDRLLWLAAVTSCHDMLLLWHLTVTSCHHMLMRHPAMTSWRDSLLWHPDVASCGDILPWHLAVTSYRDILRWHSMVSSCCDLLLWLAAVTSCRQLLLWHFAASSCCSIFASYP